MDRQLTVVLGDDGGPWNKHRHPQHVHLFFFRDVGDNGGPWNKHSLIIILENPKIKFGFSRFRLPVSCFLLIFRAMRSL
jgi:hypothetical protein